MLCSSEQLAIRESRSPSPVTAALPQAAGFYRQNEKCIKWTIPCDGQAADIPEPEQLVIETIEDHTRLPLIRITSATTEQNDEENNDACAKIFNKQNLLVQALRQCETKIKLQESDEKDAETEQKEKNLVRGGLLGGTLGSAGFYLLHGSTRSVGTGYYFLAAMAGATGGAFFFYHLIERKMQLISSFEGDLAQSLGAIKTLKEQIILLKNSHVEISEKITEATKVTEKVTKLIPQVVAVSGDNAKLADVMKLLLAQNVSLNTRVVQLEHALQEKVCTLATTPEQAEEILERAGVPADPLVVARIARQKIALAAYNKTRWLGSRTTQFKKIPVEWLTKNNYTDLLAPVATQTSVSEAAQEE